MRTSFRTDTSVPRLSFEQLECRLTLTAGAVGSLERIYSDLSAITAVGVQVGDFDRESYSGWQYDSLDIGTAGGLLIDNDGGRAQAIGNAHEKIFPPTDYTVLALMGGTNWFGADAECRSLQTAAGIESHGSLYSEFEYHEPAGNTAELELHVHVILSASGVDAVSESWAQLYDAQEVDLGVGIGNVGGHFSASHGSSGSTASQTWDVSGFLPDSNGDFSEHIGGGFFVHKEFVIPIYDLSIVHSGNSTSDSENSEAFGPGAFAKSDWGFGGWTFFYVTEAGEDSLPGDFNRDNNVDIQDYELWKNGDPRADADMDGVPDSDDFSTWAAHAVGVQIVTSNANSGTGSLRAAISAAEADSSANNIVFAPTVTTITVSSQLSATGVNIIGPGADLLTISGGGTTRVLSTTDTLIEGVTITGGYASSGGYGGGIVGQNLVVRESRITGNTATGGGGGVSCLGSFQLIDSEVSENHAGGSGGGLDLQSNLSGYTIAIRNSTISGNEAGTGAFGVGGGVSSYLLDNGGPGVDFTITNSTISGNSARNGGGGVYSAYYSPYGGFSSSPKINNTIIAKNTDFSSNARDVAGNAFDSSSSHNLIGYDPYGLFASGTGNLRGTTSARDPRLATLDFYGGRTKTQPLFFDSPAIDAGDNDFVAVDVAFDQRGAFHDRVLDGDQDSDVLVDIGAFEYDYWDLFS